MKQFEMIQMLKKSQIFLNLWVEVSQNLKETQDHVDEMDWKEVLSSVWTSVKHEICSLVDLIQKESLKLDVAFKHFIWSNGKRKKIYDELQILYNFKKKLDDSENAVYNLDSAVFSISNVCEIKKNSKSLKWVLDFVKIQQLKGDFEDLNQILNTEENIDLTLKDIDETTLEKFPKQLRDMEPSKLAVLKDFIEQRELIEWLQNTKMTDVSEVKVMCDLALSSTGETPVETDKILHLLDATQCFAPLLFHLEDVNCLDELLEKCAEVWENVDQDNRILEKWKSSGDNLEWLKDRESLVGSDQKQSLALAQSINERGLYTVGITKIIRPTLENCVSLTIQDTDSTPKKGKNSGKYDLPALQDLQSRLALIAGEEDQGQQDIAQFVELFTVVKTLAEAFVNLTNAGCMLFNDFTAMISSSLCKDINDRQNEHNLKITIHFMEQSAPLSGTTSLYVLQELSKTLRLSYYQWTDYINSKRLKHYHLNEYNIQQITYLCHQLATVENTALLPDQVLSLLSNDSKSLASGIIQEARDQAIKINDEEPDEEEMGETERNIDGEDSMSEMEKKKRTLRILVNRERLPEHLAKAAIQAVGYDNIDECNNWVLLYQYDENEVQSNLKKFNAERAFAHQSNEEEELTSILDNKSMHSLTEMIDQIINTLNVDESEPKIVGAVKTICKRYFEKTKVLTMQDYLSVEHLGKFLTHLHENHDIKHKVVKDLEPPLEKGRPNLIVCQEAEIIPTLLSLYMKNRDQPLPTASEVLLCSKQTTSDEVERFMRRALCKCKSNGQPLFCMAFTEKLKPKVSNSVEDIFEELLQQQRHLNTDYQLVVLSGSQQHYISECFDKHQIQLVKKESFEKDISNYLKMHLSTTDNEVGPFIVKIVEADRSGIGKSLYVKDLSKQLDKRWFEKCSQIEHMHAFLNVLKRDANNVVPKRSLPVPMEKGKFNIIFTPEADILPALLSLYMADQGQPLPIASEVLLCCQQTSEEEVERFLRRAMCKTSKQDKRLFTIAYGERIRPEVVKRIEKLSESLSTNMHANEEYQLAILTSDMTSFEWCRHHRVFQVAEDSAHCDSEKISLYLDNKSIGSYESIRLTPATKVEELHRNDTYSTGDAPDIWHKTTIRLLEKTINTDPILDRLYQSAHIHNEDNHFIHLDLTPAVENGIERFMFNLLVLGSIQDNRGRVWNRQKQHLYVIEMTRSELNRQQISKNSILNMLPRVKCLSPLESLEKLRNVRSKTFEVLKQHLSVSNPNTDGYEEIKKVHECVNHNAKYLLSEYQYEEQNVIGMDYMTDLLNYSGFPNSVIPLIIKMIPEDKYEEFKSIHDEEGLQNIMLMAYKKFISSTFQRPYQYLKHAAVKDINLDDFQYREPEGNQEDCIETFLNSYVSDNPTWAQLRHFASFMNVQLKNCEECIFCQKVSMEGGQIWQDTELRGLKDFAVKFMIRMSQDFATPSMQIADQSSKDVDENTDSLARHQVRREWEGKTHPYLFFNEDRTMTFINVALNRGGDLLDEDANILEKNIASKKLMQGLHAQRLEFEFNFQEKSRIEKLNTLRTIMGLPPSTDDPDPTYELTTDNVLKILAIYMRLKCNIPVIVMGETGCGKTRMVEFMSKLRAAGNENVRNMVTLKVHGGVMAEDIYRSVAKANKIAKENAARNISTVLFYDEANTTTAIHAIKEVVCDNTINGKSFYDRKLEIVAACNPYKSLSEKAIQVLENSGLGYRVSASETTNCFGKIPIRRLVYKVVPLPPSMQPFVWDFGQLSVESEQRYIHQMTKHLAEKLKLDNQDKNLIDYILCSAQSYMKIEMKDECRYVSLRDVERCLIFFHFFHDQQEFLFPRIEHKLGEDQPTISTTLRCLIQTIGVCYHVSLYNRQKFREHISKCLKKKQITLNQRQINEELVACQDVFLGNLKIERNIAPNEALCENVYLITICCELRIPLFLVGKPGSSKSLAKTIVSNNMEGKKSKSPLFKRLKKIKMISYQCSALTDAAGIKQKFKECSDLQKGDKDLNSYSAVVVLDEIGLAEDSPNMPLKVLHPLLECGSTESGTIADTKPTDKVGFVGISNWALDPAKMNRGIFVTRSTPNEKDLLETAKSIMQKQNHFMAEEIEILDGLTKAYLNIYHNQRYKQVSKEYFGLRDYYSMIKMINATSEDKDKCEFKDIAYAVQRNFSGGHESHFKALTTAVKKQYVFEDEVAEKSVTDMIKDNLKENDSRFLLLLTNQHSSVSMLEHLIEDFHKNVQIIFGSSFAGDHTYTEICKNINRIKVCMEAGRTVVLLDMTEVHESLYDALNQHYTIYGGQRYVDIGLGGHRVKCRIANNFRLVVMEKKDFVYQHYPIPLVNRLEKHHLESINLLNNSQLHVSAKLKTWCQTFAKVDNFNEKDAFLGYHDNTSSSVILARDKTRNIELYKGVLLQCVATDAMFRAKVPEKERLLDIYTREQVHDNLLNLLNHTFGTSKKNLTVLEITSFSNILTTKDRQKLESSLSLKQNSIMLLSLLLFDTQQEYLSNLEKFFKSEVSQEKKILLVQCPQAQRHGSLIACAKYGLTNMIKDITKHEPDCQIIVAFLLSIQRQHSSHTEKQSQLMLQHTKSVEIVYVDDLRPPGAGNVIVSRFYEKKLTDVLRMGQQEIDEQARMHQEGINFIALLKDSICQAMSRIRRKNETDARNLQCIEYITSLCSQNPALRGKFLSIMANCMTEIYKERDSDGSLAMSSKSWMTKEALSPFRLQEGGTFGKTLCLCLKRHLSDLLAFIISCIDENNNLDFVLKNDYKQWQTELWFEFFKTLKLEWKKMKGRQEFNVDFENHLTKSFSPQFPFSFVLNSIFCQNWSTLQNEDSATRLKIFDNMFSERPEAKIIADACEHNKDEIVRAYATDALTCNFNFGNIEESVKERLVDILLNIFHRTKNELGEYQSHNVVTLVYNCLQEYLPHLCMICEIFKILPSTADDTTKWIEIQEHIDDFVIHSLALKKLLEWLSEYDIADDASCVGWMSLTNRCKRIYHGNRQLIPDMELKEKISEKWEPISLLDLLLLQLLPNADDELFTNYVKVIVNHAKRLLKPLQRYGSRHKNFLKILLNVLRKSYEDIKLKLLVSWQDLSCRRCRKILAEEPVVLPCNHFMCKDCTDEMFAATETRKQCPQCSEKMPDDFRTDQAKLTQQQESLLQKFRSNCTSFFLEYSSQFCFSSKEHDMKDHAKLFLYELIMETSINQGRLELETLALDLNIATKSKIFQLLMQHHSDILEEEINNIFLNITGDSNLTSKQLKDLITVVLTAYEAEVKVGDWENFERIWGSVGKSTNISLQILRMLATLRSYIHQYMRTSDVRKRKEIIKPNLHSLIDICASDETDALSTFAVKSGCQMFGTEWFDFICIHNRLKHLVPNKMKRIMNDKVIDYWLILGEEYATMRATLHRMSNEIYSEQLRSCFSDGNDITKLLPKILAVINFANNQYIEASKEQMSRWMENTELLFAVIRTLGKHIPGISKKQSNILKQLLILTGSVVICQPSLLQNFCILCTNPADVEKLFWPGMPVSMYFSIRDALQSETQVAVYACPNGHPYIIGECTRPWIESKCPACGETIGGRLHVAAEGNERIEQTEESQAGYQLNSDTAGKDDPSDRMSKQGVALVHFIIHCCMLVGLEHDEEIISRMLNKDSPQESRKYLHTKLQENIETFANAMGRNMDDAIMIIHSCFKSILNTKLEDENEPDWNSMNSRCDWEAQFREKYLLPVFQNVDAAIAEAQQNINAVEKLENMLLYRIVNEVATEEQPDQLVWYHPLFWKTIKHPNASHLLQYVRDSASTGRVLKIILESPDLHLLQHMENVLTLQKMFIYRYQNQIDMKQAEEITLIHFMDEQSDYRQRVQIENDIGDYIKFWNSIYGMFRQHPDKQIKEYLKDIDVFSPISMALPSSRGRGKCAKLLAEYLIDIHNNFLEKCSSALKITNGHTVEVARLGSNFIRIDKQNDLLPLIRMHTSYTITEDELGNHHQISYNIDALEKQVREKYVTYQPRINKKSLPCMKYPQDVGVGSDWDNVLENIPQDPLSAKLSQEVDDLVTNQDVTPADVCEGVRTLTHAISFLAKIKVDRTKTLQKYMEENLLLSPNHMAMIPKSALTCHTLALYQRLMWHKAVNFVQQGLDPYKEALYEVTQEEIEDEDVLRRLKDAFDHTDMNLFQQRVNEMLIKVPDFTPTWSLTENVFSYLEFIEENTPDWYERIPNEICFKHISHLFRLSVKGIKLPENNNET
uniref:E3 ubiquitin-protein ligase rnf213-alpha-like isoform X1 n=1 Tax=Styela clava TaxID=7725 RepID=UPI0019393312|nr:E3 ubiquitin-protein ligase rnf213-alpha-like isoform X1 [Styela clava]